MAWVRQLFVKVGEPGFFLDGLRLLLFCGKWGGLQDLFWGFGAEMFDLVWLGAWKVCFGLM